MYFFIFVFAPCTSQSHSIGVPTKALTYFYIKTFLNPILKMLQHVSIIRSSSRSCLFLAKITMLKTFTT